MQRGPGYLRSSGQTCGSGAEQWFSSADAPRSPSGKRSARGDSKGQKPSAQHKPEASSSQHGTKPRLSVSYGQECVLWHLEGELGQLANCTLENDKPLENSKV